MSDPLFQPTLQEHGSPERDLPQWAASSFRANAEAPWNLSSQFWVAFLGGIVAIGTIAYLNAGRLRMSSRARTLIVALTLAFWAAWTWIFFLVWTGRVEGDKSTARLVARVSAVILYLLLATIQKKADRAWRMFSGRGYDPLSKAGFAAGLAGWAIQMIPVATLYYTVGSP